MSWEAITALGTAITAVVIVVTALVGIGQLRQFRAQRQDIAAVELVRSIQDDAFLKAYRTVIELPAGGAAAAAATSTVYEEAATLLGFRFEMIGVLVCRGVIPFDVAEELVGGLVVGTWQQLESVTIRKRESLKWPTYLEWFQWLAEQFEIRDRLQQVPAFIRMKDWSSQSKARD